METGTARLGMTPKLQHRIRAAGLLVEAGRILLVKHVVGDDTYWIPPGGGFESDTDASTRDTVRREFFEETGLEVDVGPLVYVREFAEPAMGRFHMELFYRIDARRGEPTWPTSKAWAATSSTSANWPGSAARNWPPCPSIPPNCWTTPGIASPLPCRPSAISACRPCPTPLLWERIHSRKAGYRWDRWDSLRSSHPTKALHRTAL